MDEIIKEDGEGPIGGGGISTTTDIAQFTPVLGAPSKRSKPQKLALDGSGPTAKKKKRKRFKEFIKGDK